MKKENLALNLSNQGNLCQAENTALTQYNFVVIFEPCFPHQSEPEIKSFEREKTPVSIFLSKSGELILDGISNISADDIQIYTDKKTSKG
ncbi:MAG: hypothetical protein GX175_11170 [Halanaerobiaceae bacterium]|jgi:hypothetical protein|nr:hypothetical protein [Halanaerobiaceae bacterium]